MANFNASGLEAMTAIQVSTWLEGKGYPDEVCDAFIDQEMDGEAVVAAFGTTPGPDCFRDVLPKVGQRMKVYRDIKLLMERQSPPSPSPTLSSTETLVVEETPPSTRGRSSTTKRRFPSDTESETNTSSNTASKRDEIIVKKQGFIPNPFPIPIFRKHTQDILDKGKINDDDRKYIVSVLGTMMLTYVDKASKKDCLIVAESLIRRYPFMKEPQSWQHYIYNKCQNVNRDPSGRNKSEPSFKRRKLNSTSHNVHSYPRIEEGEDAESYQRNLAKLEKELGQQKQSVATLKELMRRTYSERRKWILHDAISSKEIWTLFPLLKKASFVSGELELIMKNSEVETDFNENWRKWSPAVIDYSMATARPSAGLRHALKDLPPNPIPSDDYNIAYTHELEELTVLRCLGYYLTTKKRGQASQTSDDYIDIPYILNICPSRTPPKDCTDHNNNLPHIVKINNSDYELSPQYFIALEQELIAECQGCIHASSTPLCLQCFLSPPITKFLSFLRGEHFQVSSFREKFKDC